MGQQSQTETDYFGLAAEWDKELYASMKKQRTIAWAIAAVSLLLAGLSVFAVTVLTPLKETVPYVIMVDKTTGHLEAIQELDRDAVITENEAVVQAELVRYVIARETFDATDMQNRLNAVRLTSDSPIFRRYAALLAENVKNYNTLTKRNVKIKSVSMDSSGEKAFVRFSTDLIVNEHVTTEHWIATIGYKFVDLKIPTEERFINPLGFIVVSYRVDPENI